MARLTDEQVINVKSTLKPKSDFLRYKDRKTAEFPMLVNFAAGLFILFSNVGDPKAIWFMPLSLINLGIALIIYLRNFTDDPKERK